MCRENKDSSQLADGFHNVGFFWNYMYVILAFHVTVFKDTTLGRSKRRKKKGAMWTDIRITVQYNRVQLFFHHRYYWNIYIYTYDTCCSKSLYQVVSVVLLDLLLNLAQSAKVNPTCQKKKKERQIPARLCIQLDIHEGLLLHYTGIPQKGTFIAPPHPHSSTTSLFNSTCVAPACTQAHRLHVNYKTEAS